MPWRYFYSTEESDIALKAILAGQDYVTGNALVKGVYEYKLLLDHDSDYAILANKIALGGIKALASPERISQFGNIISDNYFDTSHYAAGCSYRDTDTLANMITKYIAYFKVGRLIAQRDLDLQGSASLGTVVLTLNSKYLKTYNVPVNGAVSDRTLIKAVIDSTTPAVTQTNATGNQAMFDYDSGPAMPTLSSSSTPTSGTIAEFLEKATDKKIRPSTAYILGSTSNAEIIIDFASIVTGQLTVIYTAAYGWTGPGTDADVKLTVNISTDNISYTEIASHSRQQQGDGIFVNVDNFASKTFRYLKLNAMSNGYAGNTAKMNIREIMLQ